MKIPLRSRKRGINSYVITCINERLHLLAKDEKGYPFYQLALVATRRKRVPVFFNFAFTQNDWQGQGRREGGGQGGQNTWGPDWFGRPEILIKHLVIALLSRGLGACNA